MAWELNIHTLDVGQGESSLVVLSDIMAVPPRYLSILIDGGLLRYASTVHAKILTAARKADGTPGVDYILVSHYDDDHSGGIAALLLADNLSIMCNRLAAYAAPFANGAHPAATIARVSFAVMAATWGALSVANDPDVTNGLLQAGNAGGGLAVLDAVNYGVRIAENHGPYGGLNGVTLITPKNLRSLAAKGAGIAMGIAMGMGAPNPGAATIRLGIFNALRQQMRDYAQFDTGGIYGTATMIDIGDAVVPADLYGLAINGTVSINNGGQIANAGPVRGRISRPALATRLPLAGLVGVGDPVADVVSTPLANGGAAPPGSAWHGTLPPP
ncbi:MAG: MBL fold metallo-hydrolase, partial [bacterium]